MGVNWKIDADDSVIRMNYITTGVYCPTYKITMMNRTTAERDNVSDHEIMSFEQHRAFYATNNILLKIS